MKLIIRSDSVVIEGYVNAVERNSKPLTERGMTFIERIKAGAFARALKRAKDVRVFLNHGRDLGGTADGSITLEEDSIGLKARAVITDPEVIDDARKGNLVGWSFGFYDVPGGYEQLRDEESGLPLRIVKDLELYEVSILNRKKSPAYVGTLVSVRDDGTETRLNIADENEEEIEEVTEEQPTEPVKRTEPSEPETVKKEVSSEYYSPYKNMISELKELVRTNKED